MSKLGIFIPSLESHCLCPFIEDHNSCQRVPLCIASGLRFPEPSPPIRAGSSQGYRDLVCGSCNSAHTFA